ncbi:MULTISPECIES: anti-sigma factor [Anaeromyxobacter]|uniref:anti-sigma factor family protein n=1 Tax=Anaeromyxobacter TaxID=161492 RepID=UPI001F57664A|nr:MULTISPECIES: zf-HC2 domain-containing protein [unclassified Anaeromyxobacter]
MLSGTLAPLRCDELSERLSELIDGERDPAVLVRVRLHVARCPPCARLALELLATVEAMHGLSRLVRPPPSALH